MVTFPPCKINLGLQILSKRSDGFHEIATGFFPVPFTDALEVLPSNKMAFTQTGLLIEGSSDDNLCLKAYRLLKEDFDLPPIQIHLHKVIPTGAGLGGGSSDAAYTLRMLNEIFELKISSSQLMSYAKQLGSDCAFFTQDETMIGKGKGELLAPISINVNKYYLALISPKIHISSAEAYAGVVPAIPNESLDQLLQQPMTSWKGSLKNDFEISVFRKHPSIGKMKETLYLMGATYASMSGSGSTVFGIFEKKVDLKKYFTNESVWMGRL